MMIEIGRRSVHVS